MIELPLDKKARELYEFYSQHDIIGVNDSYEAVVMDVIGDIGCIEGLIEEDCSSSNIDTFQLGVKDDFKFSFTYEYDMWMTSTSGHFLALACIRLFTLCAKNGWCAHVWDSFEDVELHHFKDSSPKECTYTIASCLTRYADRNQNVGMALHWIQVLSVKLEIDLLWHIDMLFKNDKCEII